MGIEFEYAMPSSKGRPAVVAPPHPLYGGSMDNPVVTTLAEALSACGYAPLRFNWRGVGRSSGSPSGRIEDAVADYGAAIDKVLETAPTAGARVLAAGYSFGAMAALLVAEREMSARLERLILVAPPLQMIDEIDLASIEVPIHVIVGENDQYAAAQELADLLSNARQPRVDVIPDADHFFAVPHWTLKLGELVRASLS